MDMEDKIILLMEDNPVHDRHIDDAELGRPDDALKELNLAMTLRANEASILYNAACLYAMLKRKPEALEALSKAWEAGFRDVSHARRDPDLALLHGEALFEKMYPEKDMAGSNLQNS